jgi:hypothetical protein
MTGSTRTNIYFAQNAAHETAALVGNLELAN